MKCFYVPAVEIKINNYDLSISRYKELKGQILRDIAELKGLLDQ